jgi:hypothetical protein
VSFFCVAFHSNQYNEQSSSSHERR